MITMSSSEFTRICRELYSLNETVNIETSKNSIKFSVNSENVGGSIKIEEKYFGDHSYDNSMKIAQEVKI